MSATAFQRMRREQAALETQQKKEGDSSIDLANMKKDELIELAKEQGLEVTSKMTKEHLINAIQNEE